MIWAWSRIRCVWGKRSYMCVGLIICMFKCGSKVWAAYTTYSSLFVILVWKTWPSELCVLARDFVSWKQDFPHHSFRFKWRSIATRTLQKVLWCSVLQLSVDVSSHSCQLLKFWLGLRRRMHNVGFNVLGICQIMFAFHFVFNYICAVPGINKGVDFPCICNT